MVDNKPVIFMWHSCDQSCDDNDHATISPCYNRLLED